MYSPANSTFLIHDSWNVSLPRSVVPPLFVGVVVDDAGLDELEQAARTVDMPPLASSTAPAPPIAPLRRNDRRSSDRLLRSNSSDTGASPFGPRVPDRVTLSTSVAANPRRLCVSLLSLGDERRVTPVTAAALE